MRNDLTSHFQTLELPPPAAAWLLDLWDVTQAFDDIVDGDATPDINSLMWLSLIALPTNAFYQQHSGSLSPVMATALLKWHASNTAENLGRADAKSYMWRASYYDVVAFVVLLCHGPERAFKTSHQVMSLYGESYKSYLKEFSHHA